MSKRTLTPLAIFSQSNLTGNESDLGSGIDFFDDRWLDWDGNGQVNFRARFLSCPTPPQVGAGLQTIRALVRRSPLSGSQTVNAEFRLQQNGQAVTSFGSFDITDPNSQLFTFTFDASLLIDPSGINPEIVIDQNSGGTGQGRSGLDVGAAELIYQDGVGNFRLVRWRACDGTCCIDAPRFPLGAGTPADPHQGSDCLHHSPAIGKQFHGCALIEDAQQQPTPGVKSILKGMEADDSLDIFLATCVNWPQNTTPTEDINPEPPMGSAPPRELGNCCWRWEPDI